MADAGGVSLPCRPVMASLSASRIRWAGSSDLSHVILARDTGTRSLAQGTGSTSPRGEFARRDLARTELVRARDADAWPAHRALSHLPQHYGKRLSTNTLPPHRTHRTRGSRSPHGDAGLRLDCSAGVEYLRRLGEG